MKSVLGSRQWAVLQGDCRELLRAMPAESVHCVVTSPPYWGLRDYGLPPLVWGRERCWHGGEHVWDSPAPGRKRDEQHLLALGERLGCGGGNKASAANHSQDTSGQICVECGEAWRGSLGLEPTPELYIAHMVEVFCEVKRVLRRDGTCWVNMGSSFWSGQQDDMMQLRDDLSAEDRAYVLAELAKCKVL